MLDIRIVPRTTQREESPDKETENEEMEAYGALDGIGAIIIHTIGKILFP
jgi:hypothetical protein